MKCTFCESDPCTCGEAYKNLTDNKLFTQLFMLQQEAKRRKSDVSITVDGTPLDSYLANLNVKPGDDSLLSRLKNEIDIPHYFSLILDINKGKKLTEFIHAPIEGSTHVRFPLLLMLYLNSETEESSIRAALTDILINYIAGDALRPYIENLRSRLDTANKGVYCSILNSLITQIVQASTFTDNCRIRENANSVLNAITSILKILDEPKDIIVNAVSLMLCTYSNYHYLMNRFITEDKKNIRSWLEDKLYDIDYPMTNTLMQRATFVSGDTL